MSPAILFLLVTLAGVAAQGGAPTTAPRPVALDRPFDPAAARSRSVLVIPIKDSIGVSTAYFVKRSIRKAHEQHVGVILFEFDTPGGDLGSMIEICRELGRLSDIPTVGFVNPAATSAGAIILAGVNHIYMSESSTVGAAALVASSPEGGIVDLPERVREKYNSFVRAEVRTLAEHNGHPFALFQAMVDQDLQVSEVTVDGRRRIMTRQEIDNLDIRRDRGEIRDYQVGEVICPQGKLLTLTNREAERWGLSRGSVASRDDLLRRLGLGDFTVTVSSTTASEKLARFLTHPAVVLILMLVGAIGIYVELNTPGFGVPGTVGIAALALVFFGGYVAGLANWLDPLLFLVGAVLLAIEIFVTPGFGVLGVSGILLMIAALVLALQDFVLPTTIFQQDVLTRNLITVFGGFVLSAIGIMVLAAYVQRTRAFGVIALRASDAAAGLKGSAVAERAVVGDVGQAVTSLRPAGRAQFGEDFLDVVTEGEFVRPGSAVEVLRVDSNRIVVRPRPEGKEGRS